jgi:hypothetical protein
VFNLIDTRKNTAMRLHIEKMQADGWSITGRDPVRLELGVQVRVVRNGVLIDGQ